MTTTPASVRLRPNARILVIKTQAIGDLLMTTPAIRDLRAAYPFAHIALMVGAWSAKAVGKNPHLDEIVSFEDAVLLDKRPWGMIQLLWKIRRLKFDAAVIFHPSPFLHLFAWLAGIPVRFGLQRGGSSRFLTAGIEEDLGSETYYPVNFQRVVALTGAQTGVPDFEVHSDADDEAAVMQLLARAGIAAGEDFLVVAPGGGRNSKEDVPARRWPPEKFADLCREAQRLHPGLKIVLTGAAGDRAETALIAREIPGAADFTAQNTLTQLYALVRKSRAVLCNDSSLLHIAVACKKPAVCPFGPTGLLQRLPLWAAPFALQSGIACSPCYVGGRFPGCEIGHQCLREMTAAQMLPALERALSYIAA